MIAFKRLGGNRKMAVKIGIFGLSRGLNFIKCAKLLGLEIVAICDMDQKRLDFAKNRCP